MRLIIECDQEIKSLNIVFGDQSSEVTVSPVLDTKTSATASEYKRDEDRVSKKSDRPVVDTGIDLESRESSVDSDFSGVSV